MNPTQVKDVAVIVVGLNACAYVTQCLESLTSATWRHYTHEVIYIDNGSTDNTLAMLRDRFPDVKVIANPTNLGFCTAANQGAALANSLYYFFLNDDIIVLDDAIPLLVEFLEHSPAAGVVGSRLLNPDLSDQWSGRRFPTPVNAIFGRRSMLSRWFPHAKPVVHYLCKEQLQGSAPFVVDWVSAAALLVSKDTFHRLRGFVEDYYYFHELIFCDRVRKAGQEIFLHPCSKIIHFEGKGSGVRAYSVRKRHIINFHVGAYRWYSEHYQLGWYNPLRWLASVVIGARAMVLLAMHRVASLAEKS